MDHNNIIKCKLCEFTISKHRLINKQRISNNDKLERHFKKQHNKAYHDIQQTLNKEQLYTAIWANETS